MISMAVFFRLVMAKPSEGLVPPSLGIHRDTGSPAPATPGKTRRGDPVSAARNSARMAKPGTIWMLLATMTRSSIASVMYLVRRYFSLSVIASTPLGHSFHTLIAKFDATRATISGKASTRFRSGCSSKNAFQRRLELLPSLTMSMNKSLSFVSRAMNRLLLLFSSSSSVGMFTRDGIQIQRFNLASSVRNGMSYPSTSWKKIVPILPQIFSTRSRRTGSRRSFNASFESLRLSSVTFALAAFSSCSAPPGFPFPGAGALFVSF